MWTVQVVTVKNVDKKSSKDIIFIADHQGWILLNVYNDCM